MRACSPNEDFSRHVRRRKAGEWVEEANACDFLPVRDNNFLQPKQAIVPQLNFEVTPHERTKGVKKARCGEGAGRRGHVS